MLRRYIYIYRQRSYCIVGAGEITSVALDEYGRAWGWASNASGQLGNFSASGQATPVTVRGNRKTFCKIATGLNSTSSLDRLGRGWGWGSNSYGQLGNLSNINQSTPVSILGSRKTFCKISSGEQYTTAIDFRGLIFSWGLNGRGQIGDNSVTSRRTPKSIFGAKKTFCKVIAGMGAQKTLAIQHNGTIWSWGYNSNGDLGNNSTVSYSTPVSIHGAKKTFCEIGCGHNHGQAIDQYGQVWSWGLNSYGILGDNTINSKRTPVSVLGSKKTFCQVSGGYRHSGAIEYNGQLWCWGYNNYGQLGVNSTISKRTPVLVYI